VFGLFGFFLAFVKLCGFRLWGFFLLAAFLRAQDESWDGICVIIRHGADLAIAHLLAISEVQHFSLHLLVHFAWMFYFLSISGAQRGWNLHKREEMEIAGRLKKSWGSLQILFLFSLLRTIFGILELASDTKL
jgi:hypothetical protein